jgi:hypothetical protein
VKTKFFTKILRPKWSFVKSILDKWKPRSELELELELLRDFDQRRLAVDGHAGVAEEGVRKALHDLQPDAGDAGLDQLVGEDDRLILEPIL